MRLLILVFLLGFHPPPALAGPSKLDAKTRAVLRKQVHEAQSAKRHHDYRREVAAWEEVHRLSKQPLMLVNIADALVRLGDPRAAVERYRQYLAEEPNGKASSTAQQRLAKLASALPPEPVKSPPPAAMSEPPPVVPLITEKSAPVVASPDASALPVAPDAGALPLLAPSLHGLAKAPPPEPPAFVKPEPQPSPPAGGSPPDKPARKRTGLWVAVAAAAVVVGGAVTVGVLWPQYPSATTTLDYPGR